MDYLYVDASTLVAIALDDPRRAQAALPMLAASKHVGTSGLSLVECQAALSQELRDEPQLLVDAEQNLNRLLIRLQILAIAPAVLTQARHLVKRYRTSLGLRSADAIHVATANEVRDAIGEQGSRLIEYLTSDRRQHAAFTAEGYAGTFLP